ncbi:MAG: hypothetical protein FWH33_06520 [Oscillospiraceae bacterium]|nr:hypothetical protein [Oscillospiraceae bacterium]
MPYLFAVIAILVVANFYLLFRRRNKGRNVGKTAKAQREAQVKHHADLVRKLDREQEDAARRVELRNKTLEMYEQVKTNSAEKEKAENADSVAHTNGSDGSPDGADSADSAQHTDVPDSVDSADHAGNSDSEERTASAQDK